MTLTPRDLSRIREIHELRHRAGLGQTTDERIVRIALIDGMDKEIHELRRLAEAFERGPGLVQRQAS